MTAEEPSRSTGIHSLNVKDFWVPSVYTTLATCEVDMVNKHIEFSNTTVTYVVVPLDHFFMGVGKANDGREGKNECRKLHNEWR